MLFHPRVIFNPFVDVENNERQGIITVGLINVFSRLHIYLLIQLLILHRFADMLERATCHKGVREDH